MKRRQFVKTLLAVSIAGAIPAMSRVSDPFNPDNLVIKYDGVADHIVNVYSIDDLPTPIDRVIYMADNTDYRFMKPISVNLRVK